MACTESIPEGLISLALPADHVDGKVAYREEVRHPALPFPKVATGMLMLESDGWLVRHQMTPDEEILEIGETVLRVRQGADGEANLLPIPSEMRDLFKLLRNVVVRDHRTVELGKVSDVEIDAEGWRMPFGKFADDASVWVTGCGSRMRGFLIQKDDGVERRTTFEIGTDTSG